MDLSLLQENLNTALAHVSRFVSPKAQLPILSNILFSTDQGRLKLSATNLELGINYWLGAKINTEGSFTIPAKDITEFVSYLSSGKIDLTLDDKSLLSVVSPKAQSSFTTSPPSDFPLLPSLNPDTAFELDAALFIDSAAQITFAAAADDSRPVLTSILSIFSTDNLTLVATDGFRLSVKHLRLVNPLNLQSDNQVLLIPSRSLSELTKLAKTNEKIKLGLSPDGHQLIFVMDDLELVSRLLEGEFPDYQRIIPQSFTTKIFLNRTELVQSIKIASVFARQSANVVKINVKSSSLDITANAPQLGHNVTTVDAKVEGEPLEIAFNYKFISDFLSVCKGDEITIELNDPLTPACLRDQSDPAFTHIIMPVRIQD